MKRKIPLTSLAQYKHVKFLVATEKQAVVAYRLVMTKLIADLRKLMKKKKLAKSEDLEKGLKGDWQKEGYTFDHSFFDDMTGSIVIAKDRHGSAVGSYTFNRGGNSLYVSNSHTDSDHRRKGLASAAYALAEKHHGMKISPEGELQSNDAKALWSQANKPFGKSGVQRRPGKSIGGSVYVHRVYEHTLPQDKLATAKQRLGDFKYDVVKYNNNGSFSFIQSPDFDTADEPVVGNSRLVAADGSVRDIRAPSDPWIYHHKWQFVGDDYDGFDVNESKNRSKEWQAVPGVDKARIGKRSFWEQNVVPKLKKSEDPSDPEQLEAGWTGDIPQIEVDLEALTAKVIDKYMSGLRWVLMGDFAGAEAKKAAEAIGLKGKVTPGIVHGAYLQSLDSHAQHYKDVTGQDAPEMPTDLVKASFDQIIKRVGRFVDQTLAQLKLDVIGAVDRKIADHNFKALNEAHSEAHDALPAVGPTEAVAEAGESISDVLSARALEAELKRTADNFEKKWDLAVRTDLAMASAAGTHQALLEIHGSDNPDVKVAWIEMEDERVCSFCHTASKNPDGTHKLYSMTDFQPSGYNYSRKRAEWRLSIPPAHPRCRCNLVYIPPGFKVDSDGSLSKK